MNKLFNIKTLCIAFAMLFSLQVSAQSREALRQQIQEWGECRNVAITETNGDLALYGKNGYANLGCPDDLNEAIEALNAKGEFIDDVQLTEEGRWLILYGNNGVLWNGIPESLEAQIREFNAANEVINSITFNDQGDWLMISRNYVVTSDSDETDAITAACEEYGKVWAACITNDALVVVYENGYKFDGNVPESLKEALQEVDFNVFRLKVSGECWFIADVDGNCQYEM